jgi:hypothetical protein
MSDLGDAVERKLAAQRIDQRDADLETARRERANQVALASLHARLRDVAAYLQTKLTPKLITVGAGGLLGRRELTAPGFIWTNNRDAHSKVLIALLSSGDVWEHFASYGAQGHGHVKDLGKELGTRLTLFGHFFEVDPVSGHLTVSPAYGKEDPTLPSVSLDDAMSTIAAGFIARYR